ncbi:endonuclease/exonuclease/phosphatase family protein [Candidatus Neptunochlamydia vexilliferae]|uniref:Endonuclease/exonuclease/phosphatase domain-containing protein n=1 Tax=Candidatus Neptunichlamydia vexilliferae TaxID=1651774 RepID=A0ABS0B1F7_9BACT|nr:endonuclease/exonuclease/phosphatase family protein [Candidatus Neptunochlamydia vexilliferae]MBF5060229.1 hypothetical protein [Candidatus Neptunochlamydia vexilliferae]
MIEEDCDSLTIANRAESVLWYFQEHAFSPIENIAQRILCGLGMAFSLPLAIGSHLIKLCSSKRYTYWKGEEEELLPEQTQVLHLNVCMFPGSLPSAYGGMRTAGERMEELCTFIHKENPDIIFLSEFSGTLSPRLYEGLKEKYAHFFVNIGPKGFGMGASMAVLSRVPIVSEPKFIPSKTVHSGGQSYIKRGYFIKISMRIPLPLGRGGSIAPF